MANEIGTATGLDDFFGRIVNFLTTNPALVSAGQAWEVLRLRRDNLESYTTNIEESTAANSTRTIKHTFRYDPRTLNTDNLTSTDMMFMTYYATLGSSYFRMTLKQSREVKKVRIQAPPAYYANYSPRSFRLQYSDNGTSWTTALTVTNTSVFEGSERRDFAVPGSPGSHKYWQVILDQSHHGTTSGNFGWSEFLLLEADGTVANHFGSEVIFKAPGNSGRDKIYTGIRSEYDAALGWYNFFMNGYTGFDPNEQSWFLQPGALPDYRSAIPRMVPMVPLWDTSMKYWLVASGRSFRFAVKVSSNYEGGYLGFLLPYSTPNQYPYPLAVGGSLVPTPGTRSVDWRYSAVTGRHGVYPGPGGETGYTHETGHTTLYLRSPEGSWGHIGNRPSTSGANYSETINYPTQSSSIPFAPSGNWRYVWPHAAIQLSTTSSQRPFRECLGGGYLLMPCIVAQRAPTFAVWGELEGTYYISGFENAAENTTTYAGKNHVVFQNAYRNAINEFWALSLD